MPPMLLDALAPLVQLLGVAAFNGGLEILARGAVTALESLGDRREIVRIDRQSGESGLQREQLVQRVRRGGLRQALLRHVAALAQPAADRLHRSIAGIGLRVLLQLTEGVEQGLGVARGGEPLADIGDAGG